MSRQRIHSDHPDRPADRAAVPNEARAGEDVPEQVVLDFVVVLDHEVAPRPHQAADERREHDLVSPIYGLLKLAQAPGDHEAAGEEAERESDPERLDRDAEDDDFGLHRVSRPVAPSIRGLYAMTRPIRRTAPGSVQQRQSKSASAMPTGKRHPRMPAANRGPMPTAESGDASATITSMTKQRSQFGKDGGLQARMLLTMFLLGIIYVVFVGALFAAGAAAGVIVVIAVFMLALQFFASDKIALSTLGAKEVTPEQEPELHGIIERLCVQADLPKPRVCVMDTPMPNAFAMGRSQKKATVCATTGILRMLDTAELEGVMAHELTHVINRDVMVMTLASFFASLAALIAQFTLFFGGGFGGGYGRSREEEEGIMLVLVVSVLVYAISFLLLQALSRYREFAADRGSAVLTGRPSALASALLKISGTMERIPSQDLRKAEGMSAFFIIPARTKKSLMNIFSDHPSLEKRLEALSRLESQLQSAA